MTHGNEVQAFGFSKAETVVVTSANTATQLMRIPWPDPYNMKARIKKILVSNVDVSGAQLLIWDADLSNSTPLTRGTGNITNCLMNIGVAAAVNSGATSTTVLLDNLPRLEFEAGVAIVSNRLNLNVVAEFEIY